METKRYDVGGKTRAGRTYPEGTILKLTDEQAKTLGLSGADLSDMTTTADGAVARDYDAAMASQDEMRAAEHAAIEAKAAASEAGDDTPKTARRSAGRSATATT